MQERNLCSQGIIALALCSIGFVIYNVALKLPKNVCKLNSCKLINHGIKPSGQH